MAIVGHVGDGEGRGGRGLVVRGEGVGEGGGGGRGGGGRQTEMRKMHVRVYSTNEPKVRLFGTL